MLNDEHFKVVWYNSNSSEVFPNVDIKGGVTVTLRNTNIKFGKIGIFAKHKEVSTIINKVIATEFISLKNIVYAPESYRLSKLFHSEKPEISNLLSKGHLYDLTTNIFDKLSNYLYDEKPSDNNKYIQIYGRINNERTFKWILRKYVDPHENLDKYKVILPKSNGSGSFGEALTMPIVGLAGQGHTQTFISIGKFNTLEEAEACLKYIKTKLARLLLSSLKVTQDNKKETWSNVPLQDFTSTSDIDWSQSISDIDRQLYAKYGLSDEEIAFIEKMIKPME